MSSLYDLSPNDIRDDTNDPDAVAIDKILLADEDEKIGLVDLIWIMEQRGIIADDPIDEILADDPGMSLIDLAEELRKSDATYQGPAKPRKPTRYPAGSAKKIRIMIARAEAGVLLFHPNDAGPDNAEVIKNSVRNANGSDKRTGLTDRSKRA